MDKGFWTVSWEIYRSSTGDFISFCEFSVLDISSLEDSTFINGSLTKGDSIIMVYLSVPSGFSNIIDS